MIPGVLVGLFAGGFIDRHAKRPVMIWSDVVRALLVLSIPVAAWSAHLGIVQLYAVAALVGGFSALFRLADNAYLPVLIGREHLVEGNSKLQATDSVAEIGGPGLAGVLIQWLTAPVTMVIDAFSYVVSAVVLARIRAQESIVATVSEGSSLLEDLRIGARAGLAIRSSAPHSGRLRSTTSPTVSSWRCTCSTDWRRFRSAWRRWAS